MNGLFDRAGEARAERGGVGFQQCFEFCAQLFVGSALGVLNLLPVPLPVGQGACGNRVLPRHLLPGRG